MERKYDQLCTNISTSWYQYRQSLRSSTNPKMEMKNGSTTIAFLTILLLVLYLWQSIFPSGEMLMLLKEQNSAGKSVDKRPKQLIVMGGQSNMAGRGGVVVRNFGNNTILRVWDGSVPSESHPNPNVYRFNENFQWEPAKEPIHAGIGCTTTCGVGVGMAFANHLLTLDPDFGAIGLVPCAAGGTSLKNWTTPTDYPYPSLLYRTRMAIKSGGVLRAVLWYQGESDSKYYSFGKSYNQNLRLLVSKLRADLESPMLPWFEVIIPHPKPPFEGPLIEDVRKAQMGLDLPNVVKVDGDGLPMGGDGIHLTSEGYVKLGYLLAEAVFRHKSLLFSNLNNNVTTTNSTPCS